VLEHSAFLLKILSKSVRFDSGHFNTAPALSAPSRLAFAAILLRFHRKFKVSLEVLCRYGILDTLSKRIWRQIHGYQNVHLLKVHFWGTKTAVVRVLSSPKA
jgi:hypothetical protein